MYQIPHPLTGSPFPIEAANSTHDQRDRRQCKTVWRRCLLCVAAIFIGSASPIGAGLAFAQPVEVPETWGGDIGSRPRLTGDWGGLRDTLGEKGVVFDVDLLMIPQGVFSGGIDEDNETFFNVEYTLNLDTQKLGLWPGGFLKVVAQTSFGTNILGDVGSLSPANTAGLLPRPGVDDTALMNATFTQFLSPRFGVFVGKIFTLDGFEGEFGGNYRTQFMNTGLAMPLALGLVPLSAYGGGAIFLPWEGALLSVMAIDSNGTPWEDDIGQAFDDGTTVVASLKAKIEPFGLVGHQSIGAMWSNKTRVSLVQDPSNIATTFATESFPALQNPGPILTGILERTFPALLVPTQPANQEDETWAVFYAFDQYLWQPDDDPERGVGVFFHFGAADDKTNPIEFSYAIGLGGKGVVPGRPRDSFGIGYARLELSDNFIPFVRSRLDLGLEHEDIVEAYYNAAVTPWMDVSLDLQIIRTGLQRKPGSGGSLRDVDTAVVGGLRAYIRF